MRTDQQRLHPEQDRCPGLVNRLPYAGSLVDEPGSAAVGATVMRLR
ncbi:hypothetical protein AB0I54_35465 [Streptomyces sp. NPDC050625]